MKAVIMAGGKGTRLRPLTYERPKPLVPLVGKSCILYILDLLKANGITDVCITLMYLGDKIKQSLSSVSDMNITYMTESRPLGTAGSVKNCREFLAGEDDFIVISGDCVCDFNLKRAVCYHKEKGGKATIVLTRTDDPVEYGTVVTACDGSVAKFVEKPSWSKVYTDTVNTGIYILSADIFRFFNDDVCDFSKDVFPSLMAQGEKIYAYRAQGYWCDIGNVAAYKRCTRDILSGKVRVRKVLDVMRDRNVFVPENCEVIEPSYIGSDVFLENATIGPYSVIEDGCRVIGASVESSVLFSGTSVNKGACVRNSIVCENSDIAERVSIGEYSVIGCDVSIGSGAVIGAGTIIDGASVIADDAFVCSEHFGGKFTCEDDRFVCGNGKCKVSDFFPVGFAACEISEKNIAVAYSGGDEKLLPYALAVTAGAVQTGKDVYDCGSCDLNIFRFTVRHFGFDCGVYIANDEKGLYVLFLESDGLYVRREKERKISQSLALPCKDLCDFANVGKVRKISGHTQLYVKKIGDLLKGVKTSCAVFGIKYFADAAEKTKYPKEFLHILPDGMVFQNALHEAYSDDTVRCAAAFCVGRLSKKVCIPFDYPLVIDEVAERFGFSVVRTTLDDAERSDLYTLCDPCLAAAAILRYMYDNNCTFFDIVSLLPKFASRKREVAVSCGRAAVMSELSSEKNRDLSDGIRVRGKLGSVLIVPKKNSDTLRIFAEAADSETAAEICDFYVKKLKSR